LILKIVSLLKVRGLKVEVMVGLVCYYISYYIQLLHFQVKLLIGKIAGLLRIVFSKEDPLLIVIETNYLGSKV
jgi:hypothetical protein